MPFVRPRFVLSLAAVLLAGASGASAAALDVNLNFASLPSAQGFTYIATGSHAGVLEGNVFSVSGGTLLQDTMGEALGTTGGGLFYQMTGGITATDTKQIHARARCLQAEGSSVFPAGQGGFVFGFATGSVQFDFGITPTKIYYLQGSSQVLLAGTYDNTQFHDYLFDFTPPSTIRIYRDGTLVHSGTGGGALAVNRWFFGDATGGANARGEVASLRFIQDVATPAEPVSWGRVKAGYR